MDYQISEDEFNSIASCADQIDLLTSLCAYIPAGHHAIAIPGLDSFLSAQNRVLRATLKALEERDDAQRNSKTSAAVAAASEPKALSMPVELLVRIMQACSGATQGDEAVMQIHSDLYDASVMHGHGEPLKAFHAALRRQGMGIEVIVGNGVCQTTLKRNKPKKATQPVKAPRVGASKRERLVATS